MIRLSTDDQSPPNEEIVNVLRRHPGRGLGTAQIAEEVGMSADGARNRLNELVEEGWVEKESIGSGQNPPDAWYLAAGQREKPIPPEINRLIRKLEWSKSTGYYCYSVSKLVAGIGLFVIVVALTAAIQNQSFTVGGQNLLSWGYALTIGGAAGVGMGLGFVGLSILTERAATWQFVSHSNG